MNILIDQGGYAFKNFGDWAMLEVAVKRIREMWPDARISILCEDANRLKACIPGAIAVPVRGRYLAFASGALLGPLKRFASQLERRLLHRWHPFAHPVVKVKKIVRGRSPQELEDMERYVEALRSADLVICSGGGFLTDSFEGMVVGVTSTIEVAHAMGKPVAMFGQGLGPLTRDDLRLLVADALRKVDVLALREERQSLPLLKSLGVPTDRAIITGDDAVEAAFEHRAAELGQSIGLNLRRASYSGVNASGVELVCSEVAGYSSRVGASITATPISFFDQESDEAAVAEWITECLQPAQTPLDVVRRIGNCRVVVTGSYHAGVFALSQGVSAVGITNSNYYRDKFYGLADQFGTGCHVVDLQSPAVRNECRNVLQKAWDDAPAVRQSLLAAAKQQVAASREAYTRLTAFTSCLSRSE